MINSKKQYRKKLLREDGGKKWLNKLQKNNSNL